MGGMFSQTFNTYVRIGGLRGGQKNRWGFKKIDFEFVCFEELCVLFWKGMCFWKNKLMIFSIPRGWEALCDLELDESFRGKNNSSISALCLKLWPFEGAYNWICRTSGRGFLLIAHPHIFATPISILSTSQSLSFSNYWFVGSIGELAICFVCCIVW